MIKKLLCDKQVAVFLLLGQPAADYLENHMDARQPIKKNVLKMLDLKKEYGASSLRYALGKCMGVKLHRADYISNILYQEMMPDVRHPPVKQKIRELKLRNCERNIESVASFCAGKESLFHPGNGAFA
ncbi:MAG: hypothetical protein OEM02_13295 [Desulfobulbaceae bacterium]|nr:hypothetical protein [Desulfobulbaceae bacterium]